MEAVGTFAKLQESGLDFAKQLALELNEHSEEEEDEETELYKTHTTYNFVRQLSETSLHTPMRQISESSGALVSFSYFNKFYKILG